MAAVNPGNRVKGVTRIANPAGAAIGNPVSPPAAIPTDATAADNIALLKALINLSILWDRDVPGVATVTTLSIVNDVDEFDLQTLYAANNFPVPTNHNINFTIATIGTSVELTLEGKSTTSPWANLAVDNQNTIYTANGDFSLRVPAPVDQIRLILKVIDGGTPTISGIHYKGSRTR